MPKRLLIKLIAVILFFSSQLAQSQPAQDIQKLSDLVNDAVYFTKIFVTPATDAAVYQASNGWMNAPKKAELWDLNVGLHGNVFFVPKSNRTFIVSNSDFKFFKVPGGSATVQTALGSDDQIPLTGNIGGQDVVVKSPEGVSAEALEYVYLQASLGLWYGTELITKFSPVVKIGNFDYQVYGVGLKHNLDQYIPSLVKNNLHLAAMASYGREDLGVKFLDVQTQYGNLGLNQLTSVIDTYQFQVNFSKQFNKFELGTGLIFNSSNFNYKMGGEPGSIENTIPAQQILNTKLLELGTTKSNLLADVSGRYPYRKFFFQATVGIGKFINSNLSVQYQIK
jgi:hypothetical protein